MAKRAEKRAPVKRERIGPTRNWEFGCVLLGSPAEKQEFIKTINEQMSLSRDYYNELVAVHLENRNSYRTKRAELLTPEQEEEAVSINLQIEGLTNRIKSIRAKEGNKKKMLPEIIEIENQIKVLKYNRKQLECDELVEYSKKLNEDFKDRDNAIYTAFIAKNLYWGTMALAKRAFKAAQKTNFKAGSLDIEPKRFFGEGQFGVQLTPRGPEGNKRFLTTQEFLTGKNDLDGIIKISRYTPPQKERKNVPSPDSKNAHSKWIVVNEFPLPSDQWETSAGRRNAIVNVQLRIGQVPKSKKPIWSPPFALHLHRKLPNGFITWAWIQAKKIGVVTKYQLVLSIESKEFNSIPSKGLGTIAIAVGWKVTPGGGLLVGNSIDDKGNKQQYIIPPELRARLDTIPSGLRNYGDTHFNDAKETITQWLKNNETPSWFFEKKEDKFVWFPPSGENISQWRSRARLARLSYKWCHEVLHDKLNFVWDLWKNERLNLKKDLFADSSEIFKWASDHNFNAADEQIAIYLEIWRRKNRHLYQWESDTRAKAIANRQDVYRNIVSRIGRSYDNVVFRNVDFARLARLSDEDKKDPAIKAVRKNIFITAPGEFRSAFISSLGEKRVRFIDCSSSDPACILAEYFGVNSVVVVESEPTAVTTSVAS